MSKPPLIFQGTGKRISKEEIAAYDNDVDVYWQPNAWTDMIFSVQWIKNTLAAAVEGLDDYALYCDNLTAQVSDDFMKEVRQNKGIVWFGTPNGTHFWQPVDAGAGKVFKSRIKQEQSIWLELDENIEIWLRNDERKLSAKDRCILITGWVGNAYQKASKDEKFQSMLYSSFEKTSCLITADGREDKKIQPEGMPGYIVPPPVDVSNDNDDIETQIPAEVREDPNDVLPESDVEEECEEADENEDKRNIFTVLFEQ